MKAERRGKNTALVGLGVQAVCAVVLLSVGAWTGAKSAVAAAWLLAGCIGVWIMSAVVLYCRQLERQEEAELAELSGKPDGGSIFAEGRDGAARQAVRRRRFVEKWGVRIFSLAWAGYLLLTGLMVLVMVKALATRGGLAPVTNAGAGVMVLLLAAFVAFLFSRYATGMASRSEWQPLRPAGGVMLLGAMAMGAAAVAMGAAWWGYGQVDVAVALAVPAVQVVLACETLISLVLDFYRPRVPGREDRLSYDSRLLGLLAEPHRVGHSIAETLNYQFGFEVSRSWFYRLVSAAVLPLVLFAALVLVGMSSLVIVRQGEQCVVLRWGQRTAGRLLDAGLHVKWPWPVETAEHFDVGVVRESLLGVGAERERVMVNGHELQLWTTAHGPYNELDFLLAIPPRARESSGATTQPAGAGEQKPPPVNLIKLVVSVQYQVVDAEKFGYRFADAAKLLECAAYREMVRYCASATLADAGGGDAARPEAIMTSGWQKAAEALGERINRVVGGEGLDLGVRIVKVNLMSVHPPPEAAGAYEEVLAAERAQDQLRFAAEGEASRMLCRVAGDAPSALQLAMAIKELEAMENLAGLSGDAAAFQRDLASHVRSIEDNLRMLQEEIGRESLLGKLAGAEGAGKAHLAGECRRQLELLKRMAADRSSVDVKAEVERARKRADELFAVAAGEPAAEVASAKAYRWTREMAERSRAESFEKELLAWKASPQLYRLDRWLSVWDEVLPGARKFVLGVPRDRIELWLNWENGQGARMEGAFETVEGK